jgi:hypothetical protein
MPATPVPAQRDPFSVAGFVIGLIAMVACVAASALVSQFAVIYRDFNLTLPAMTQWMVDAAQLLRDVYFAPLILIPIATGFGLPLVDRLIPMPLAQRRLFRGTIGAIVLLVILVASLIAIVLTLYAPLVSLMSGMTGGGKTPAGP